MSRVSLNFLSIPALVMLGIVAGCGAADEADGEPVNAAAPTEESSGGSTEVDGEVSPGNGSSNDASTDDADEDLAQPVDASPSIDMNIPPEPDAHAVDADHPGYEWAFRSGHQAGAYGREDYYDPSTVSEQGSFAGLEAEQAYRAGFALGLAQYQTQQEAQAAEAEAAEEERLANYPVGELLEGWDPRVAVSEFWDMGEVKTCDLATVQDPCLDTWYTSRNTEVIALSRLPGSPDPEPDQALLLKSTIGGFEIQESWLATSAVPLPDWAQQEN